MFASNNDARANATPKTILLDMARSQSTIELRPKPVSSEREITTERVNQLARQIVEHVAVAIPLKVHVHGCGQITKSFALRHEVTVPRPREMIGQYWNSVFSQEREHFEPRPEGRLRINRIAWIDVALPRSRLRKHSEVNKLRSLAVPRGIGTHLARRHIGKRVGCRLCCKESARNACRRACEETSARKRSFFVVGINRRCGGTRGVPVRHWHRKPPWIGHQEAIVPEQRRRWPSGARR